MAHSQHRTRAMVAIAASLVLHAALLRWWALQENPAPVAAPAPVEVDVVHLPPPPEPRMEIEVPPPTPAPRPGRPKVSKAPAKVEVEPPSASDTPLAASPAVPSGISLVPSSDFAVPTPREGPPALPHVTQKVGPSADQLMKDLVHETIGRGKVERGLVHPYYAQLGKTLMKTWDADRSVSQKGLKGFSQQFAENSRVWNDIWLEKAAAFGASGSPLQKENAVRDLPLPPPTGMQLPGAPDLAARAELRREMREQFKATRRAVLKVVQDATGALLSVELVSPSNDPYVDKEAMADIRKAATQFPPPPPEVHGRREQLVSLWQFELIVSITPPVPTFTFEFDEALGFIDTRLPLDRRIYKRVRLLSVE